MNSESPADPPTALDNRRTPCAVRPRRPSTSSDVPGADHHMPNDEELLDYLKQTAANLQDARRRVREL
ncbi:polyketide synthase docking domain-containing protein, partial [Streptomyces sp. B1866]|uniref:polyketide synthase docking domain-containing protein n=1 Tax=Streptomyces sp. B1866 TaxID=3075431 RepID=UPI00288CF333